MDEFSEEIAAELHAKISEVFKDYEDNMVNRWVLGVELIREDGVRGNTFMWSPDMRLWEIIGMHETASEYARAQLTLDYISDLDEDEEDVEDEQEQL